MIRPKVFLSVLIIPVLLSTIAPMFAQQPAPQGGRGGARGGQAAGAPGASNRGSVCV